MIWIAGGEFTMGTNDVRSFPNERPAHRVHVEGFWIDEHDVTNAEFAKFVEAKGYVTTGAETGLGRTEKGAATRDSQAGRKRAGGIGTNHPRG